MSAVFLIGDVVDTRAELGCPEGLLSMPDLPKRWSMVRPAGERRFSELLYSTLGRCLWFVTLACRTMCSLQSPDAALTGKRGWKRETVGGEGFSKKSRHQGFVAFRGLWKKGSRGPRILEVKVEREREREKG